MSKGAKGAKFENEVKDFLEELNYFVVRSAGSRGIADLVALKEGIVLLVQCKTNGVISLKEKKELIDLGEKLRANVAVASKGETGIVLL